jgi:hypothetical protein
MVTLAANAHDSTARIAPDVHVSPVSRFSDILGMLPPNIGGGARASFEIKSTGLMVMTMPPRGRRPTRRTGNLQESCNYGFGVHDLTSANLRDNRTGTVAYHTNRSQILSDAETAKGDIQNG